MVQNESVSPSWVDQAEELYRQGKPLTEVGGVVGRSGEAIRRQLLKRGVTIRSRGDYRTTPSWVDQAEELYRQGKSLTDVGEVVGRGSEAVRRQLLKKGVTMRPKGSHLRPTPSWVDQAEKLYCQGNTLAEIEKIIGKGHGSIRYQLLKRGVPMHRKNECLVEDWNWPPRP